TLTRGKVVVPDAYLFVRHVQKHKFLRPIEVAQPDGTTKTETVPHADWLVTFHVYADKSERAELGAPLCGGVLRFQADGISDPEAEAYKRLDALTLTEGWAFEVTGDA
ncbi:MAG: hypothetical protein KGI52_16720, partial [Burkholderiales bacterium]|nr:hypothetical protein [Burkholderiales bacterium]